MKEKPAIAYWKYVVNDFDNWLNRFCVWSRIIFDYCNKITTDGLLNVFEFDSMFYN